MFWFQLLYHEDMFYIYCKLNVFGVLDFWSNAIRYLVMPPKPLGKCDSFSFHFEGVISFYVILKREKSSVSLKPSTEGFIMPQRKHSHLLLLEMQLHTVVKMTDASYL